MHLKFAQDLRPQVYSMEVYADLHIHTALSPCAEESMTPNNIVNMAVLKGLGAIAITDHNSSENAKACMDAALGRGIVVIPGMELQTREDIHVVCLFNSLEVANTFQEFVYKYLPPIKNRADIFGEQLLFDKYDNISGVNDRMLLSSSEISFDDAFEKVKKLNGLFIPAHVDRDSYSVLCSLGFVPDYLDIKLLEYHSNKNLELLLNNGILSKRYKYIKSSDAHYLHQILERDEAICIEDICSIGDVKEFFKCFGL